MPSFRGVDYLLVDSLFASSRASIGDIRIFTISPSEQDLNFSRTSIDEANLAALSRLGTEDAQRIVEDVRDFLAL